MACRNDIIGPRTVELCHLCLHRALDLAVTLGLAGRNIAAVVRPPRRPIPERDAWTVDEVRHFLAVASQSGYGPIWLLMTATGMRRGEALGLRWSDVDLEAGVITVNQALVDIGGHMHKRPPKGGRGGRSHRSLPLEPPIVAALATHRERQSERAATLGAAWADTDLVFTSEVGTPINARNLARQFKGLIEKAGVRDIPIHSVRHSVATYLVSSGEDVRTVADYLGHDPRVPVSTYAHVVAHRKVEVARRLGGLLPPAGDGVSPREL